MVALNGLPMRRAFLIVEAVIGFFLPIGAVCLAPIAVLFMLMAGAEIGVAPFLYFLVWWSLGVAGVLGLYYLIPLVFDEKARIDKPGLMLTLLLCGTVAWGVFIYIARDGGLMAYFLWITMLVGLHFVLLVWSQGNS